MQNYYTILGVDREATQEELQSAYRKRSKEAHPDYGGSTEEQILVNEAYSILSNPEKRKQYDSGVCSEKISFSRLAYEWVYTQTALLLSDKKRDLLNELVLRCGQVRVTVKRRRVELESIIHYLSELRYPTKSLINPIQDRISFEIQQCQNRIEQEEQVLLMMDEVKALLGLYTPLSLPLDFTFSSAFSYESEKDRAAKDSRV